MTEPPRRRGDDVLYQDTNGEWVTADRLSPQGWLDNIKVEMVNLDERINNNTPLVESLRGSPWKDELSMQTIKSHVRHVLSTHGLTDAEVRKVIADSVWEATPGENGMQVNIDLKLPPEAESVMVELRRDLGAD